MFGIAVVALFAVSLSAASPAVNNHADWPSDLNGDGKVTLSELQASCRAVALRADSDGDGRISSGEWGAAAKKLRQKTLDLGLRPWRRTDDDLFIRIDTDRDGFITADEINVATIRRFDRRDLNHDGVITFDEASRGDLHAIQP
jgi:Ca2+-binding EF-hand superfamily protein